MKSIWYKFCCAFRGVGLAIKDKSIALQLLLMCIVLFFFSFFSLSTIEWCVIIGCCGFVIVVEVGNTCIERILDFIQPKKDEKVRYIKDMSAGMVLIACIFALVIGLFILGGKI
ncbi:diacylglycerol kinase [Breznakia sp. PF5-3]|uniref:diacylglycerol kinase n=1 Tax=unclassified Breznakia TaxID=2623764 RepID=UPI002406CCA0|nr:MULTISPECIES: diacylglycerol kinase [unclassified Breznakia]MDF9824427.1 diacylglycerol kinase [Breznakia sp. PM6-1]MDF9835156.1 diacylglycerol kinase [Breznakia sp. PF5-3]MDF9838319.1 diacylglycerol kinase [Breznakia sp. PFB2-8]MDF9860335.1 diacylglycerol kinase [Breznakia sp. PH5-24]